MSGRFAVAGGGRHGDAAHSQSAGFRDGHDGFHAGPGVLRGFVRRVLRPAARGLRGRVSVQRIGRRFHRHAPGRVHADYLHLLRRGVGRAQRELFPGGRAAIELLADHRLHQRHRRRRDCRAPPLPPPSHPPRVGGSRRERAVLRALLHAHPRQRHHRAQRCRPGGTGERFLAVRHRQRQRPGRTLDPGDRRGARQRSRPHHGLRCRRLHGLCAHRVGLERHPHDSGRLRRAAGFLRRGGESGQLPGADRARTGYWRSSAGTWRPTRSIRARPCPRCWEARASR